MSLKNVDIDSALRRLAERRIEDAMREGKFDNLAGAGQPIELEPIPAQEEARLLWWALKILKQNDVIPDEIRLRKQIAQWQTQLSSAASEQQVKQLCTLINTAVTKINTMGTNALNMPAVLVDVDEQLQLFAARANQLAT